MENQDFTKEAIQIVDEAKNADVTLRVLGATAFRIHSPNNINVHDALQRRLTDIDFMSYSKDKNRIEQFFEGSLKYQTVRAAMTPGLFVGRCIFFDESGVRPHIDVFLDRLDMNHVIDFRGRLEIDYPTIPLAELLLEKVQIVHINEKDIKDSILLLLEHDVGEGDRETINVERFKKLMADDWGFYFTTKTNLNKIDNFFRRYEVLTDQQREIVASRIDKLLQAIENTPKSLKWKLRAKVGASKKWYNEVEEVERAEHLNELNLGS